MTILEEPEKWVNLETIAEHTGLSKDMDGKVFTALYRLIISLCEITNRLKAA